MKKIKNIFLIISLVIMVTGCYNQKDELAGHYISFTVTKEENDELNMYVYTYDFDTKQIVPKTKIPYTSQYPLTVYSKEDNSIYYSNRDDGKNDQLYVLNLDTNKEKRLTDSLFAINYIIPLKDTLYIAAVERGQRAINLYTLENGKLNCLVDKDLFVWQLHYNPIINTMAFSTYSQKELDDQIDNNIADPLLENTIYTLDTKTKEITSIAETQPGNINSLAIDRSGKIFYNLKGPKEIYNKETTDSEFLENLDISIGSIIYSNEDFIYYINGGTKIIEYDIKNKTSNVLYETDIEKAHINNAILL